MAPVNKLINSVGSMANKNLQHANGVVNGRMQEVLKRKNINVKNLGEAKRVNDSPRPGTYRMNRNEKGMLGKGYDFMAKNMRLSPEGAKRVDYSQSKDLLDGAKMTGKWFTQGTTSDKFKKGALGVGGYMAANTAVRNQDGGSMTYNNRGERDIAGIPFI